ncbi:MAG TPA: hypothetical protein VFL65_00895 [Jatrophihabitans sp.]|nr:hypothetical protein [Jatrophihabitans sp.]
MGGAVEHAPQALADLFNKCKAAAPSLGLKLGGILGDQAHTYGYHRARAVLPSSDYSCQLADDRAGDAWSASALDLTPTGAEAQRLITQRLIDATARKDPRLLAVREFFGSVDGRNVTGRDVRGGYAVTSDDSHLWHVHLSIFRRYANDAAALAPIVDVVAGNSKEEDPLAGYTLDQIANAVWAHAYKNRITGKAVRMDAYVETINWQAYDVRGRLASPAAVAAAVVEALPHGADGAPLTVADVEKAVRAVFADAGKAA